MARFFGVESLGPEHVSPEVPHDSPRHHGNRNAGPEAAADRVLSKLTPQLARDPNGHTVEVPRDKPLKPGWRAMGAPNKAPTHSWWRALGPKDGCGETPTRTTRIANSVNPKTLTAKGWTLIGPDVGQAAPSNLDEPHDIGDGQTMTMRDQLHGELEAKAHEIRIGDYRSPHRRPFYDGTDYIVPMDNDRDINDKHPAAFDPKRVKGDKP